MDEEERSDRQSFYDDIQDLIFNTAFPPSSSRTTSTTTEVSQTEIDEQITEELFEPYDCTCKYSDQSDDQSQVGEDVILSPTSSDILYESLVHNDNECIDDLEDKDSKDSRITPDSDDETVQAMIPFSIRYCFGFSVKTALLNLTKGDRREFCASSAHKGIIYNYETKRMRYVHGHIQPIKCMSVDNTGNWLVTSGFGIDCKTVITDTRSCRQLLIINNKNDDGGALLLGMAPDARFFISVHRLDNPIIKFWHWTQSSKPTFEYTIGKPIGEPRQIAYHPNDQSFIMIAFEKCIIYFYWNSEKMIIEDIHLVTQKRLGKVTSCVMVKNKHETFVSNTTGHIAILGNMLYTEDFSEHELDQNKFFVKKIKVCSSSIIDFQCSEHVLAVLEEKGTVKFFDTEIRLLHWVRRELPQITAISFSMNNTRDLVLVHVPIVLKLRNSKTNNIEDEWCEVDRVSEFNSIMNNETKVSKSSLHAGPFSCTDFVAACADGRVFYVDVCRKIYKPFFCVSDSPVVSVCVSPCQPYLYVAYENARVTIFNYRIFEAVITAMIPHFTPHLDDTNIPRTSLIVNSALGIHLVIARTNGEIVFLAPALKPQPNGNYRLTHCNITHLSFSENNCYMAFCDAEYTTFILHLQNDIWELNLKFRGHHSPLVDILFLYNDDPKLFTIAEDGYLVNYELNDGEFSMATRTKIEATAKPLAFIYYPTPPNAEKYFMVANSEYKYKMIHSKTFECRSVINGPSLECYETPVSRLVVLPNCHDKYIMYANETHMGIQKTPPDGSPYKYIGTLANPELSNIVVDTDGQFIFTYAKGRGGVLIWEIHHSCVDTLHYMGGYELHPFYSLIEGGGNGWFFKEIEDLFCYMQILHQEDAYASQQFTDSIYISDLVTLVRACGYYPSEYEIKLLLDDIQFRDFEATGKKRETITFTEFVKLFINHRPARGISINLMEEHFNKLFYHKVEVETDSDRSYSDVQINQVQDGPVDPHVFANILCKYGETLNEQSLASCITDLMYSNTNISGEEVFNELSPISFEYFTKVMLGILQESAYVEAQEKAIREAQADAP